MCSRASSPMASPPSIAFPPATTGRSTPRSARTPSPSSCARGRRPVADSAVRAWRAQRRGGVTSSGIALSVDLSATRTASSAIAPSAIPASSTSTRSAPAPCSTIGSRFTRAARRRLILDPGSVLHPRLEGSRPRAAGPGGRDGAVQSAGRRVPRALRRASSTPASATPMPAARAPAPCSRYARTRCRSSSKTGRPSAASSTSSLTETPELLYGRDLASHYQAQGLKLSKHFK